jgi:hypothetical protein
MPPSLGEAVPEELNGTRKLTSKPKIGRLHLDPTIIIVSNQAGTAHH